MTVIKQWNPGVAQWETILVGEQGPPGETGATGATGSPGATGPQGPAGDPQRPINGQTVTSYTLVLSDATSTINFGSSSPVTVTIPPSTSVPFVLGTRVDIIQSGAGKVTVVAGAGVTLNGTPGTALRARYSGAWLYKLFGDSWVITGDLGT